VDVDNARCAIDEYVGNELDAGRIRGGELSNRCIVNDKRDCADLITRTVARWAFYRETESPEVRLAIDTKRPGIPR
jgi:hypothetical protein